MSICATIALQRSYKSIDVLSSPSFYSEEEALMQVAILDAYTGIMEDYCSQAKVSPNGSCILRT